MQNGTVLFSQQECSRRTKYILGLQPVTHAAIFTSLSPPSASHPEVSDASASGKLLSARRDTRTSVWLDPEDSMLSVIRCQTQRETRSACSRSGAEAGIFDLVKSRASKRDEQRLGEVWGREDEEGMLNEFQEQLPTFCSKVR